MGETLLARDVEASDAADSVMVHEAASAEVEANLLMVHEAVSTEDVADAAVVREATSVEEVDVNVAVQDGVDVAVEEPLGTARETDQWTRGAGRETSAKRAKSYWHTVILE